MARLTADRPPLPLLGRLDRPARARRGDRARGADPRRPRAARRAARPARAGAAGLPPRPAARPRPRFVPDGLLGRASVGLFNELWYRRAPRARTRRAPAALRLLPPAGRRARTGTASTAAAASCSTSSSSGYGQEDALRRIVRRVCARRLPVLPRRPQALRRGRPGLALLPDARLDPRAGHPGRACPASAPSSTSWTRRWPAPGGRVYLAKDSRLRPDLLAAMYPRLDDFRALRAELDPRGVITSDLARRLGALSRPRPPHAPPPSEGASP